MFKNSTVWHGGLQRLIDVITATPHLWLRDTRLKYLNLRIDLRDSKFLLSDRESGMATPADVYEAAAKSEEQNGTAAGTDAAWQLMQEAAIARASYSHGRDGASPTHEERADRQVHRCYVVHNIDLGLLLRQRDLIQKAADGCQLTAEECNELEGAVNAYDEMIDGAEGWMTCECGACGSYTRED